MKGSFVVVAFATAFSGALHAAPPPDVNPPGIEYPSPRVAYETLRQKQGISWSKDDSGWAVAFDKEAAVIWSFAPPSEPSYPVVVKRTVMEVDGHLFIALDAKCGGSKEACDEVVRRYQAINQKIQDDAAKKRKSGQ